MSTTPQDLKRSLAPRQRSTRQIVASLDERAPKTKPKQHGAEWLELRRRMREILQANARGDSHASAADVCAFLYSAGLDR